MKNLISTNGIIFSLICLCAFMALFCRSGNVELKVNLCEDAQKVKGMRKAN